MRSRLQALVRRDLKHETGKHAGRLLIPRAAAVMYSGYPLPCDFTACMSVPNAHLAVAAARGTALDAEGGAL